MAAYYDGAMALRFVVAFELMVWCNSLLASFLKRRFGSGLLSFVLVLVVFGVIFLLEYLHVFSLFAISRALFGFIVMNPIGLLIPLGAVVVAFLLNKCFFAQNFYPEKFNSKLQNSRTATANLSFLDRFGVIGELISVQIKLMLRHKRTRTILFLSTLFLFYGLLFYTNDHQSDGMRFFLLHFYDRYPDVYVWTMVY